MRPQTPKPLQDKLEDALGSEFPQSFESPESSLVVRADYSPESRKLTVELRAGKVTKLYDAEGVKPSHWIELYESDSKGRSFAGLKMFYDFKVRQ